MKIQVGNTYNVREKDNVLFPEVEIVAYRPEYCEEFPFMGSDDCWYNESGKIAGLSQNGRYDLISEISKELSTLGPIATAVKIKNEIEALFKDPGFFEQHESEAANWIYGLFTPLIREVAQNALDKASYNAMIIHYRFNDDEKRIVLGEANAFWNPSNHVAVNRESIRKTAIIIP